MVILGAAIGFALGYANYLWLNPILEDRDDWLREMQGFLFTSILLATVGGGLLGGWLARRIRAR
jgi:hypothetical protein